MTWPTILLWTVIVILVLLPPSLDPAIRIKEYLEGQRQRLQHPGRVCARVGHDWQHSGGRNAGCHPDCCCSVPVNDCARCGDCDYGDNAEAQQTVEACPLRDTRGA